MRPQLKSIGAAIDYPARSMRQLACVTITISTWDNGDYENLKLRRFSRSLFPAPVVIGKA
jgi:hypothetical protein